MIVVFLSILLAIERAFEDKNRIAEKIKEDIIGMRNIEF